MGTPIRWSAFNLFILVALALDLGVFHRKAHKIHLKEAGLWSALWITLATVFGIGVWHWFGEQRGLEYFTGYLIEKALSVDNLFVFLVYTGLHMLWTKERDERYEKNPLFRFASRHVRVTKSYQGERFLVKEDGRRFVTPLFLVLVIVEITDVTFALDSIPAIFGITQDAFIVYTSNVFAILGLRALYFLLADLLEYFRYLGIGLAAVLIFIGGKMVGEPWVHIPVSMSLGIVAGLLTVALLFSVLGRWKSQG